MKLTTTLILSLLILSTISFAAIDFTPSGSSESDTLQSVTDRGSTTTNNITADTYFGNGSQLTGIDNASPGGSDTQIQFNDGGIFRGTSQFFWDGRKIVSYDNRSQGIVGDLFELRAGGLRADSLNPPYETFKIKSQGSVSNKEFVIETKQLVFDVDRFLLGQSGSRIGPLQFLVDADFNAWGLDLDSEGLFATSNGLRVTTGNPSGDTLNLRTDGGSTNVAKFENNQRATLYGTTALGSNTHTGLSQGDINVSTVYYDVLQSKSPIIQCSEKSCFVVSPEEQKQYWIERNEDWEITKVKGGNIKHLPTPIKNKFTELHQKKMLEKNCEYTIKGNSCIQKTKKSVTRAEATETYQKPVYETQLKNVTELNNQLEEITKLKKVKKETNKTQTKYRFKENCNWKKEIGYYCEEETLIDTI